MVLSMARPWKHPKTGIYHFRKAVPDDLYPLIGKWEEKIPLGTKDPAEAKIKHAQVAAQVALRWKALRAKPEPLTQKQIIALAGEAYREITDYVSDEPGTPAIWEHTLRLHRQAREAGKLDAWVGPTVDELLQRRGLRTDDDSRARLIEEVDKALVQADAQMKRHAEGDFRPDPEAGRFPQWEETGATRKAPSGSLRGLVDDWWKERQAIAKSGGGAAKLSTYESYRNTMQRFVAYLGHDDPQLVTAENVIGFKDHRLAEINPRSGKPVSAKTVKDSDLSGLKAVFGWAVSNRRMVVNPAAGITLKIGKRRKVREREFTDAEARALLSAALHLRQGRERPKTFAAKRWAPWLCAYSGARIGEVVQLRKKDIHKEAGEWVMTITPEAVTVKDDELRKVVLHPHLIELGFLEFVSSSKDGYLFFSADRDEDPRGKWRSIKNRVTEFVRTVVTDPNVPPNHGWRHKFMTIGLEVGIEERVLDAIEGHVPRHVGGTYGRVSIKAQAEAMTKFPRFQID